MRCPEMSGFVQEMTGPDGVLAGFSGDYTGLGGSAGFFRLRRCSRQVM